MAVKTKEELLSAISGILGDSTDDDAISLIEDVSDTLTDRDQQIASSGDWKTKYEENDREWRQKYRDRFFSETTDDPEPPEDPGTPHQLTFDDLFKTEV